jgi:protein-tyrosine phosphatase
VGVAYVRAKVAEGGRVLIHCQHGIGRSALLALCVLVDQGHEPLAALKLAKDKRELVSPSQSQYEGWAEWLRRNGHPVPDYHSFGCIAYRHLARS